MEEALKDLLEGFWGDWRPMEGLVMLASDCDYSVKFPYTPFLAKAKGRVHGGRTGGVK